MSEAQPVTLTLCLCLITAVSRILLKHGIQSSNALTGMVFSLVIGWIALALLSVFTVPLSAFNLKGVLFFALIGLVAAVAVSGTRTRDALHVTLDDNGPGFTDEALRKAFQPFATTKATGTGLGLAIVQKVVLMHNGRVGIGTSPAGGASIQLTFPLPNKQNL